MSTIRTLASRKTVLRSFTIRSDNYDIFVTFSFFECSPLFIGQVFLFRWFSPKALYTAPDERNCTVVMERTDHQSPIDMAIDIVQRKLRGYTMIGKMTPS